MSKVSKKLEDAKNFEAVDIPFKIQDYYYFDHAAIGSEDSIYYRTKKDLSFLSEKDMLDGAEAFFDPKRDLKDTKK
jgi:hypothetical protein